MSTPTTSKTKKSTPASKSDNSPSKTRKVKAPAPAPVGNSEKVDALIDRLETNIMDAVSGFDERVERVEESISELRYAAARVPISGTRTINVGGYPAPYVEPIMLTRNGGEEVIEGMNGFEACITLPQSKREYVERMRYARRQGAKDGFSSGLNLAASIFALAGLCGVAFVLYNNMNRGASSSARYSFVLSEPESFTPPSL